jgi:putative ABC transport system permease protein
MLFYIKLGLRNLLKNYRRSIKTMFTIVIGLCACVLAQGFMSHTLWGLRESLIKTGLGHFQLYRKGYLKYSSDEPYKYLINDSGEIYRELERLPGIKLIAPRLNFQGMVSSGEKSAVVLGTAGIPGKEKDLNTFATLKQGTFPGGDKPYGALIGSGVARKLNAAPGNTITLMAAMKGGGVNAVDLNIDGVIGAQVKAYDDVLMIANLGTIQGLLNLKGRADRIILLLNRTEDMPLAEPLIRKLCDKAGLEYLDWRQLAGPEYSQPRLFYDLVFLLMMIIIVLVVIFSIANTLNLAMYERVREIGTMRSLGTTRIQVGLIFISESFLIGLAGGFFGIIAGYSIAFLLNAAGGIPLPPPPGQARGYTAFFKPDIIQALIFWIVFCVTAAAAGLYPAFRAARLQIADALRWI